MFRESVASRGGCMFWMYPGRERRAGRRYLQEAMVLEMAKGMPAAQVSELVRLSDRKLWRSSMAMCNAPLLGSSLAPYVASGSVTSRRSKLL